MTQFFHKQAWTWARNMFSSKAALHGGRAFSSTGLERFLRPSRLFHRLNLFDIHYLVNILSDHKTAHSQNTKSPMKSTFLVSQFKFQKRVGKFETNQAYHVFTIAYKVATVIFFNRKVENGV